jgi:hypothetical protein
MSALPDFLSHGDHARLIPAVADTSREVRAASILLATIRSVPGLARAMLENVGQRAGSRATVECYTEVVFKNCPAGDKCRPDGLIVVETGRGRTWSCLVEAKIGRAEVDADQVLKYVALAKANGVDAVITLSNQFVALTTHSPVKLSKVATRGVGIFHWSWWYLLTEASLLLNENAFDSVEQRIILEEMIHYFEHPSIGVSTFDRMNPEWKDLVLKVHAGAPISKTSAEVENSVAAWHQESRDMCLLMSRKLKRRVQLRLNRSHAEDPAIRLRDDVERLAASQELQFILEIPDAAAQLVATANVKARTLNISMTLDAPKDRQRSASRINWIVKQLAKSEGSDIYIKAKWPGRALDTQVSLMALRKNPESLESANRAMTPVSFDVILVRDLAGKFSGARTFLEEVERAISDFYEFAGQYLRPYIAPPPKLQSGRGVGDLIDGVIGEPIIAPSSVAACSERIEPDQLIMASVSPAEIQLVPMGVDAVSAGEDTVGAAVSDKGPVIEPGERKE